MRFASRQEGPKLGRLALGLFVVALVAVAHSISSASPISAEQDKPTIRIRRDSGGAGIGGIPPPHQTYILPPPPP
jgi:hypothetical protein